MRRSARPWGRGFVHELEATISPHAWRLGVRRSPPRIYGPTPVGLLDYELRSSPSASWVRGRIGQFEATEQEYRALYAIRKTFGEKYSPADGKVPPELARGRSVAEQSLEDKFREVLGDARYAEYLSAKQPALSETSEFGPSSQTIGRIVTRLNLSGTR